MKLHDVENALLFIEPVEEKKQYDMVEYEWLVAAFDNTESGAGNPEGFSAETSYMGCHQCACGKRSTAYDYLFTNGMYTNSLCLHYLEWHRHEIPASEFIKLDQLKNNVQFYPCSRCKKYSSTVGEKYKGGKYKRCKRCRDKSRQQTRRA